MVIERHYQRFGCQSNQHAVAPIWDDRYEHYPAFRFLYAEEGKRALEVVLTSSFHLRVGLLTKHKKRFIYTTGESLKTYHLMDIFLDTEYEYAESQMLSFLQQGGKECVEMQEAITKRENPSLARWVEKTLFARSEKACDRIHKYLTIPLAMNAVSETDVNAKVQTILDKHPNHQLLFASHCEPSGHGIRVYLIVSDDVPWLMEVGTKVTCYPLTRPEEVFYVPSTSNDKTIRCLVEPSILSSRYLFSYSPNPHAFVRVFLSDINPENPAFFLFANQNGEYVRTAFGMYVFPILLLYASRNKMLLPEVFSSETWQNVVQNILA